MSTRELEQCPRTWLAAATARCRVQTCCPKALLLSVRKRACRASRSTLVEKSHSARPYGGRETRQDRTGRARQGAVSRSELKRGANASGRNLVNNEPCSSRSRHERPTRARAPPSCRPPCHTVTT